MNVNLDNTIVKAEIKSELHFEGSIDVHASGSRTKEIPQTDITPPKRLLRKIIMVGKIPVEVVLSVKLVYSGSVEASGSVEVGVKVTQEVHLSNYIEYNFEKLTEMPYYSFTAQTWDPTVEPYFSASGSVVATLNIGPLFTLSVNRAPFDWGVMPQIVATASAQLDSNLRCAAASATFEVTTNLAGSMGVGLPHIDPAAKAYEACMAMKAAVMLNPAAQAGLAKAVLKFDVNSAMEDSCNAMRSAIPSFPSMRWDWTVGTTELFSQDYAGQACIPQAQSAATNRIQQEANRQPSSSPVFEWLEQTSFDGTKCVGNPEGSAADLPTSGAYTIEAMIKPTGGGAFGIVGWGSYYHHSRVNAFRMGSTHYLLNYWWGNDLGKHLGTNLADGKFHHGAATYDGHTQRIFVDYSQVASRHASGYSATDKSSFCVGKTVNQEYFRGEMKNVRIWNHARSAQQMQELSVQQGNPDRSVQQTQDFVFIFNGCPRPHGFAKSIHRGSKTFAQCKAACTGTCNGFEINGCTRDRACSGHCWTLDNHYPRAIISNGNCVTSGSQKFYMKLEPLR
jgi:hypothetical protein